MPDKIIKYALLFLTCILSGWFWKIITTDLLFGSLVILSTISVFILLSERVKRAYTIALLLICIVINTLFVIKGFDKSLFQQSILEKLSVNTKRSYYPYLVGNIFQNKLTLGVNKYEKNFFANLDINLYFFKSHPRERPGVEEFNKYPQIFIVFFFLGVIRFLKSKIMYCLLIVTVIIGGFLKQNYLLGPIIFFPIITSLISLGFYSLYIYCQRLFPKDIR